MAQWYFVSLQSKIKKPQHLLKSKYQHGCEWQDTFPWWLKFFPSNYEISEVKYLSLLRKVHPFAVFHLIIVYMIITLYNYFKWRKIHVLKGCVSNDRTPAITWQMAAAKGLCCHSKNLHQPLLPHSTEK